MRRGYYADGHSCLALASLGWIPLLRGLLYASNLAGGAKMKVLVACEFSGIVRDAFIARGHDAVSCDLIPSERPGPHIQDDVLKHLDGGWDLMIAFPPCTHLARSGARWWSQKKADGRMDEALEFVRTLRNAPIKRIAIENPEGLLRRYLRPPTQCIEPFQFGDPWYKKNMPVALQFAKIDTDQNR